MPRPVPPPASPGLKKIRASEGMQAKLARTLKITRQAVNDWKVIPLNRVLQVEQATGISRAQLRPDIFKLLKRKKAK